MIKIGDVRITEAHRQYIYDILDSGKLTEGPYVKRFETLVKEYLGVKHAIAVTNGTVALQLVSQYIGKGKKVCVPALTFPATLNAFEITGQDCMLCDVGMDLQINIDNLTEEEKKSIDVIVPVHLMGYPANMSKILKEAKKHDWIVVEDAAEAMGASINGKKVGSFGDFACFSFYVSHNVWGGELGIVVTNNDKAAEAMRSMKNHGRVGNLMLFTHKYVGSNYKTTEISASIGCVNMYKIDSILKLRYMNAEFLSLSIKNKDLFPYPVNKGFSPLGYPIRATSRKHKDFFCKQLNRNGIETRSMFPCLANQEAYKGKFDTNKYPVANEIENNSFYIGCHQYLSTMDLEEVVNVLKTEYVENDN